MSGQGGEFLGDLVESAREDVGESSVGEGEGGEVGERGQVPWTQGGHRGGGEVEVLQGKENQVDQDQGERGEGGGGRDGGEQRGGRGEGEEEEKGSYWCQWQSGAPSVQVLNENFKYKFKLFWIRRVKRDAETESETESEEVIQFV